MHAEKAINLRDILAKMSESINSLTAILKVMTPRIDEGTGNAILSAEDQFRIAMLLSNSVDCQKDVITGLVPEDLLKEAVATKKAQENDNG